MTELTIQDLNGGTTSNVDNTITSILSPEPAADSPVDSEQSQPAATEQTISQGESPIEDRQQPVTDIAQTASDNDQRNVAGNSELESAVARLRSLIVNPTEISPWLRVHLYGRPGARKTTTAANSGLKTLVVDIEDGALSLLNHPEIAANCQVMKFESLRQLEVLAEVMHQGEFSEFQVIQFDTWSELNQEETDKAYKENQGNPALRRGAWHPDLEAGVDYQISNKRLTRIAAAFFGLDKHLIFVSHEKEEKDKNGNIIRIRPNISPGLLKYMDAFVHVTAYMTSSFQGTQGVVATIQCQPDAIIDAKTRIGGLPRTWSNPSFAQILQANAEMRKVNQ